MHCILVIDNRVKKVCNIYKSVLHVSANLNFTAFHIRYFDLIEKIYLNSVFLIQAVQELLLDTEGKKRMQE